MKALHTLAAILVVVGGLNWGLVALAEFDLVAFVFGLEFGQTSILTRLVYALVGLSAAFGAIRLATARRHAAPHGATA
jgi:uncharacterized membrane protein YuzA (DUF378 family)